MLMELLHCLKNGINLFLNSKTYSLVVFTCQHWMADTFVWLCPNIDVCFHTKYLKKRIKIFL